jgi:hypothetical protein
VIDDDMLLANDADIDGPDDALQIELVDGNLYHTDTGDIIGSVSIIGDSGSEDYGSVLVTPSAGVFFDTHDPAFANFTYVVVDEDGGRSEPVSATIDVAVGTLLDAAANPIGYDPSTSDGIDDYFMIGTDENDADAFDNNILIINEGTLDLSHISDINTIELGPDATVLGSSELGYINPSDVIGATDVNHVLVIHSAGSDDASSQVDVHESFGEASEYEGGSTPSLGVEGVYYNQYIADGATLLIEIEPPIEVE